MNVGQLLTRLIEQSNQSKNNIIREVQIDRSSFYKILGGERRPTDYQFASLIRALQPCKEDLEELVDAYEHETAGESLYQQRCEVRRFINSLSDVPENVPSMPDALRGFIVKAMEAGVDRYDAFLPIGSRALAGLFALLNENSANAEVRTLISIEESGSESILHTLSRWFRYLRPQTMRFHAYTRWETTRGLEALPFAYYIAAGDAVLMISSDEQQFMEMHDPGVVAAFHENYERQIAAAEEIASTETGYQEILQYFSGLWMSTIANGDRVCLLSPRPCLWQCSTDEMVRRYMRHEGFVQYGQMIRSLDMREFTTRSGMQQFLDESMISEAGFRIPIDSADMQAAQARIQQNTGTRTFFINEERIHLPEEWQIFLVGHKSAVFVPYATSTYMLVCTSPAVVEPLVEWCESRCGNINNDIVRS